MSWQDRAACRYEDPELFFPTGHAGPAKLQVRKAKRVCTACPVRQQCLDYALDVGEGNGVWGGASEDERRTMKRRSSRERATAAREERKN